MSETGRGERSEIEKAFIGTDKQQCNSVNAFVGRAVFSSACRTSVQAVFIVKALSDLIVRKTSETACKPR